jgi:hypothetical protein
MSEHTNQPFIKKREEYFKAIDRAASPAELAYIVRGWLATATTFDEIFWDIFFHYDSVLLGEYALSDDEIMSHACAVFKTKKDWWSLLKYCKGNKREYSSVAFENILRFAEYKEDVQMILKNVYGLDGAWETDRVFLRIIQTTHKLPPRA